MLSRRSPTRPLTPRIPPIWGDARGEWTGRGAAAEHRTTMSRVLNYSYNTIHFSTLAFTRLNPARHCDPLPKPCLAVLKTTALPRP